MPTFAFTARDEHGGQRTGAEEAASAGELASALRERGWLVLDVRQAKESEGISTDRAMELINPLNWLGVRSQDVELSMLQLAVMIRSGLSLMAALKTVGEQSRRSGMRRVWDDVQERIQGGSGLADAMNEHRCFPRFVIQLVRVGEHTGHLDPVLNRASAALERRRQLKSSLVTAMTYPVIVLVAALGVTVFMLLFAIPRLQTFLYAMGRDLPATTRALVDVSAFLQAYTGRVTLGIVTALIAAVMVYLWPPGRYWMDRLSLRIPMIGVIFRLGSTASFARNLGILLQSGVTLLEALRTVEQTHYNRYLVSRVTNARLQVMQGGNLADPLGIGGAFMPMLASMVAVGESSGTLDHVLEEVARFHELQLEAMIRQLSTIIEPIIIVVVGGIVGFVYVSFFVALFAASGA